MYKVVKNEPRASVSTVSDFKAISASSRVVLDQINFAG
jgi:hypothetical protein